jgi:hypothetical protein
MGRLLGIKSMAGSTAVVRTEGRGRNSDRCTNLDWQGCGIKPTRTAILVQNTSSPCAPGVLTHLLVCHAHGCPAVGDLPGDTRPPAWCEGKHTDELITSICMQLTSPVYACNLPLNQLFLSGWLPAVAFSTAATWGPLRTSPYPTQTPPHPPS